MTIDPNKTSSASPPQTKKKNSASIALVTTPPGGGPVVILDQLALTDTGNSERFRQRFGGIVRYVPEWKEYVVFESGRFVRDTGDVRTLEMTRAIAADLLTSPNEVIQKFGKKSSGRRSRVDMQKLAQSLPGIWVAVEDFDVDPWALSCPNGLVDLKTGEIRETHIEDLVMRQTGAPYDPAAKAPRWRRFIDEVTCGDASLAAYLQSFTGYCLTGTTGEQLFFFLYGKGANGKGTFVKVLRHVFGNYVAALRSSALMVQHGNAHPTELMPLLGARLVSVNEVPDGQSWNVERLKELTGEDVISARWVYKNDVAFDPTHKLIISGNNRPRVSGTDHATWRRVKLIPFDARFPVNVTLADELFAEAAGVLTWAIEGCLNWQRDGLIEPSRVTEATASYRESEDVVGAFVAECCCRDRETETSTANLYAAFERWSMKAGEKHLMKKRGFSDHLELMGFNRNTNDRARGFYGISLTPGWRGQGELELSALGA